VWLLFKYYTSFMQSMRDGWRLLDLVILYSGLVAQVLALVESSQDLLLSSLLSFTTSCFTLF
jgi:hypothetical protein